MRGGALMTLHVLMVLLLMHRMGVQSHDPHYCSSCARRASSLIAPHGVPHRAEPFSLSDVKLLPGSLEWTAQQTNLEYLVMLPVSSLTYNFKNTSGLPLDGAVPFGGWETPYPSSKGDDRGHFTGHWLSASALMVTATGNASLRANAEEVVKVLGECQEANAKMYPKFGPGYLHASPTIYFDCLENLWHRPCRYMQVPYYNIHKIMQGLLDQHRAGNAQALGIVEKMAKYFYRRITTLIAVNGTEVWERVLNTETGGMNDVMYQLYQLTNSSDHLAMAHLFDKQSWFAPIINKTDILANHHANTHLALTVGGAQRYEAVHDSNYRSAVTFFAETLSTAHSYSTGGSNFNEYWQAANTQGSALFTSPYGVRSSSKQTAVGHDTEESCTTYNFLKILRHLFTWTADPAYPAMYKHALTNGVLGIQYGPSKPGVMLYLLPLGVATTKNESYRKWGTPFDSFWCCYGTGVESFSKMADSIYYRGEAEPIQDGGLAKGHTGGQPVLFVTQYISSSLNVSFDAGANPSSVTLVQESFFPWGDNTTIQITGIANHASITGSVPIAIKLIIPAWLDRAPSVLVNGKPFSTDSVANSSSASFLTVARDWLEGDALSLHLPGSLRLVCLDDARMEYNTTYSFVYGDTLLVGLESPDASNVLTVPSLNVSEWSMRTSVVGQLRFTVKTVGRVVDLMPLNEVVEERYTVYYNLTVPST